MAEQKGGKGGKGAPKKKVLTGRVALYKIEGGKLTRSRRNCPKCGPGIFLAQHEDRHACGRCGYTEFMKKAA